MPAIAAFKSVATKPTNRALAPSFAKSPLRSGAIAPMPPNWIPIEEKLAKPVKANAVSWYDLSVMYSGTAFHSFICR